MRPSSVTTEAPSRSLIVILISCGVALSRPLFLIQFLGANRNFVINGFNCGSKLEIMRTL